MTETAASNSADLKKLGELIKDVKFAMLTSQSSDSSLNSRPLTTLQVEFDGTLWFLVNWDSEKVHEMQQNPRVNVGYAKPDEGEYVSVSGIARIERNPAKAQELWTAAAKPWFPGGATDPDLAVLSVHVQTAEYWEAAHSKVMRLVGLARAMISGDPGSLGENRKVEVHSERAQVHSERAEAHSERA